MKRAGTGVWISRLCTVGPLGRSPWAPGTLGALCALPISYAVGGTPLWARALLALLITGAGVAAVSAYIREREDKDPREVIIDEVAGCFIAAAFVPASWAWQLAAFGLFRAFDILKPWPISVIDKRVKNAWGVMLDDVVAGILAGAVLEGIEKMISG
jgi:phosphatidylglycerophosphatase A